MENLTFNFTLNQINVILKHLGNGIFVEVEPVISLIREQATKQLSAPPSEPEPSE